MAEVGAIGITVFAVVLGTSGISATKEMNIQDNQRIASGSYVKKNDEREEKD